MSLVFSAIVPHPPLLIPAIGKENIKKLAKTKAALEQLEEDLYISQPETLMIISPHGPMLSDSFCLNVSQRYEANLKDFGDLTTRLAFEPNLNLMLKIREAAQDKNLPVALQTDPDLDYGAAVPLYYLTKHLPKIKIVPVSFSLLDGKTHLDFGYLLKEQIMTANDRVAVIASADLAHTLSSDGPGGFRPQAKVFDETVIANLESHNTTGLLNIDAAVAKTAAECGYRSILILLGILQRVNYDLKILSYEGPLGIGYLVANFVLK